jgi:hypothetical protein
MHLAANQFSSWLYPSMQIIATNDYLFSTKDSLYYKGFYRLNYRLLFSRLQRVSIKDIRPRFGVVANFEAGNAPFNKNNFGSIFFGELNIYLPGIASNHSFLIKISGQNQRLEKFYFSNKASFPRGYLSYHSETLKSVSINYLLPIAYPDLSLSSLAYLKRISANAYFDYAENNYPARKAGVLFNQKDYLKSVGVEVFLDVHFLRTRYPFRLKYTQGWRGDNFSAFNDFSILIDFYNQ